MSSAFMAMYKASKTERITLTPPMGHMLPARSTSPVTAVLALTRQLVSLAHRATASAALLELPLPMAVTEIGQSAGMHLVVSAMPQGQRATNTRGISLYLPIP